jgi:hypothetical protein
MIGIKAAAMIIAPAAPLAAMVPWMASAHAAPVRTGGAACALAKARVAAHLHRIPSSIPDCETLRAVDSPQGYYLLALRGWCREPICGSTLIGWFAVRKRSGRIYEWDVPEMRLGPRVGSRAYPSFSSIRVSAYDP